MLHKAWNSKEEMPYCFPRSSIKFQGHTGQNITDFDPNWAFLNYRPVAAFKSLRFALFKNIFLMSKLIVDIKCPGELGLNKPIYIKIVPYSKLIFSSLSLSNFDFGSIVVREVPIWFILLCVCFPLMYWILDRKFCNPLCPLLLTWFNFNPSMDK